MGNIFKNRIKGSLALALATGVLVSPLETALLDTRPHFNVEDSVSLMDNYPIPDGIAFTIDPYFLERGRKKAEFYEKHPHLLDDFGKQISFNSQYSDYIQATT
ncbi:MAG: hypothetical protein ABIA91_02970, partial [Patescibacteria group bacterium]